MPVDLYPAPFSRIRPSPILISPSPASHALPPRPGSLAMGMGHPHPTMSMMSGMPAAAGLSYPTPEERIPGAVLTSGLASESKTFDMEERAKQSGDPHAFLIDPWIQHNSLASAVMRGYPYNTSICSERPQYRSNYADVPVQGYQQRTDGYDGGLYAYAGGMPDTLPRNSLSQSVGFGVPHAGFPGAFAMEPNMGGYASTIYPDPPERDTSSHRGQGGGGCDHCCAASRREEVERMLNDTHCDCREHRHGQHHAGQHQGHAKPARARAYSESSSEDGEEQNYYATPSRRVRPIVDNVMLSPPRRGRLRSSGSGQRTASRPPGLPSVKQQSFNSESSPDPSMPRHVARERGGRRTGLRPSIPQEHAMDYSRARDRHPDEGYREHKLARMRPEDLRLDAIHIGSHSGGEISPAPAGLRTTMDVPQWHPDTVPAIHREAHFNPAPESACEDHLRHLRARNRSRNNNDVQRRRVRSPSYTPHHLGSPLREEFAEVFPLPSKQNSPSRMHRQEYSGNAPAGPTTRSKLHPGFPHRSE